jgi:hypothetical protein
VVDCWHWHTHGYCILDVTSGKPAQ